MTTLVWIHGNGASKDSFNYLKHPLYVPCSTEINLEYDSSSGFINILSSMRSILALDADRDMFFIGHSLGGIYAAYLADIFAPRVIGGITLSTPWLGSEVAQWLQFTSKAQIYKDIAPYSNTIQNLKNITLLGNWTSLISTKGGSDLIRGENDGIVSKESMMGRNDVKYVEIASNHSEILLSNHTVEVIRNILEGI
jgi:Putative serine esterase (DUF676)